MDIDGEVLKITQKNASHHGVEIACTQEDILSVNQMPEEYDIIVSNPPYVTEAEKQQMRKNVLKYEPSKALFVPDSNPLIFYKKIIELAKKSLKEKGILYFEINEQFGLEMMALCDDSGYSFIGLIKDINGKDRFIKAYN
jgi:release factor glutamine methyltransferase